MKKKRLKVTISYCDGLILRVSKHLDVIISCSYSINFENLKKSFFQIEVTVYDQRSSTDMVSPFQSKVHFVVIKNSFHIKMTKNEHLIAEKVNILFS